MKNNTDLFPTLWQVYRYRHYWRYHFEDEFDENTSIKWDAEMKDTVYKIFNYEKYIRIMQGAKIIYSNTLDAYKYFLKIKNKEASDNLAWILKSLKETKDAYEKAIIDENYEEAQFYHNIIKMNTKPDYYLIEPDETFIAEKQRIADDIKYLEKESAKRAPKEEKELDSNKVFFEMGLRDAKYILLGLTNGSSWIVDTMETIQDDKEILYLLIWVTETFYENFVLDVMRELRAFKDYKIIKIIEKFDKDKNKQKEIEELFYSKIVSLIIELKKVDEKVLIATLKYYRNDIWKQQNILKNLENSFLLNGIKYANKIEEYELSQLIYKYINTK